MKFTGLLHYVCYLGIQRGESVSMFFHVYKFYLNISLIVISLSCICGLCYATVVQVTVVNLCHSDYTFICTCLG